MSISKLNPQTPLYQTENLNLSQTSEINSVGF